MSEKTPWPQYGELDPSATRRPSWPVAGQSAVSPNAPQTHGAPEGWGASPAQDAPGVRRVPRAQGAAGPHPPSTVQPSVATPSRGPGVAAFVIGMLVAFVVAPIVLFSFALATPGLIEAAEHAVEVRSGDTVTVAEGEAYLLSPMDSAVSACRLTGSEGVSRDMEPVPGPTHAFVARGLEAGKYTVTCEGPAEVTMIGTGVPDDTDAQRWVGGALVGATVIGVLGLALAVWGVVRIGRVNRARRRAAFR
ncbi:hypothetical protein I6B53_09565 [Schaalia sp. 19OD2882]|uniref:hypothetical protein n=1 Tax=Schaalia sp. 19OD2882 TaxID=2794089 RepID=UPI001C1EC338|nr:hypothetical protein [Schaalia sp. 19OD2882]QWW19330.1 hypothetical protein I6B53_09565 [Schaalia sp. 19OD2882]